MNGDTNLKTYFWGLLNLVLAAFLVNLIFFVMPTIKKLGDSYAPVRTLTVSAEGKTLVKPDIAVVSFSMVTRGSNPKSITDENNKKINEAIAFVKSIGVAENDVKTTGYYLAPDYRYDEHTGQSQITGYTLTQTVEVRMRDLGKIQDVLAGISDRGINQIGGVNFTVDNPDAFLGKAREEAFSKAREKASMIASEGGVALGRVITISEGGGGFPPIYYSKAMVADGIGGGGVTPPVVEPGEQELRVTVNVTYALR